MGCYGCMYVLEYCTPDNNLYNDDDDVNCLDFESSYDIPDYIIVKGEVYWVGAWYNRFSDTLSNYLPDNRE